MRLIYFINIVVLLLAVAYFIGYGNGVKDKEKDMDKYLNNLTMGE